MTHSFKGPRIAVLDTGVANIASMLAALARQGAQPFLTQSPDEFAQATHAVLPGVGAFGAGMTRLHDLHMIDAITHRFEEDAPTLCICLGLQLLCQSSQETPGVEGLGLVKGHVERFDNTNSDLRVPQLGWNLVQPQEDTRYLTDEGYAYYANSYRLSQPPNGWLVATTSHGEEFVAAMEKGRWLVCQFHPELSGQWGQDLMTRWIKGGTSIC